jgi:protein ImuA
MSKARQHDVIEALRTRIQRLERSGGTRVWDARAVLPFDVPAIDAALPLGGLACGALHEVIGGADSRFGAAATLFVSGLLARLSGPVLWCGRIPDLYAPGLAAVGLQPGRVLVAEATSNAEVLWALEEALRHAGLAAAVGEVAQLDLTPSRRLQLAAENSGVTAFVLRRPMGGAREERTAPTAAALTCWQVAAVPSRPLAAPGIGRARWRLELLRCRGGEAASWIVEACDATGHLGLPPDLADRQEAPPIRRERARGAVAG